MDVSVKYDGRRGGFCFGGTRKPLLIVWAERSERDDVIEFVARKLNDNPAFQMALGVLGADSVRFV